MVLSILLKKNIGNPDGTKKSKTAYREWSPF